MIAERVSFKSIEKAIAVAFENDTKLLDYYDDNVTVTTLDEIVVDVVRKIRTFENDVELRNVYEKNRLIGYFVYRHKLLISFALNVEYRKRKYLREFFKLIRNEITGIFGCLLFSRNKRAIGYLVKNGMRRTHVDERLTALVYFN